MKKVKRVHILVAAAVIFFALFQFVYAAGGPGTEDDPVVLQSYVDQQVMVLNQEIHNLKAQLLASQQEIEKLNSVIEGLSEADVMGGTFKVIEAKKGQRLIAGEGTELVLRWGSATAISGINGDGWADVSSGKGPESDLKDGRNIPINHLLISSRNDGRGIVITSEKAYILVKGNYELKN